MYSFIRVITYPSKNDIGADVIKRSTRNKKKKLNEFTKYPKEVNEIYSFCLNFFIIASSHLK